MHACVFCASASAAHPKLHGVDGFPVRDRDGLVLIGLAVCWGVRDAYYISLQQKQSKGKDTHMHACIHTLIPAVFPQFTVSVTPQV